MPLINSDFKNVRGDHSTLVLTHIMRLAFCSAFRKVFFYKKLHYVLMVLKNVWISFYLCQILDLKLPRLKQNNHTDTWWLQQLFSPDSRSFIVIMRYT